MNIRKYYTYVRCGIEFRDQNDPSLDHITTVVFHPIGLFAHALMSNTHVRICWILSRKNNKIHKVKKNKTLTYTHKNTTFWTISQLLFVLCSSKKELILRESNGDCWRYALWLWITCSHLVILHCTRNIHIWTIQ